jgi:hypothetical protein
VYDLFWKEEFVSLLPVETNDELEERIEDLLESSLVFFSLKKLLRSVVRLLFSVRLLLSEVPELWLITPTNMQFHDGYNLEVFLPRSVINH